MAPGREVWLDWVRGLAVCAMVLAHVLDAWTRPADRSGTVFDTAKFVGGLAAPAFLFLAGLSQVLSAERMARRTGMRTEAAEAVWRRAWQVVGLALLFRLQSWLLGFGAPVGLLKVDILNVLGLSLVAGAALWGALPQPGLRVLVVSAASAVVALLAPLTTQADLQAMPAPLRWYLQPVPGVSSFSLLPWAAFLLAGAVVGEALVRARDARGMARVQAGLLLAGVAGVAVAEWAGRQPSLYPPGVSSYWGPSPAFFLLRLALVTLLLPAAWLHARVWYGAPDTAGTASATHPSTDADRGPAARVRGLMEDWLARLGRSSLFVYWVHVELVYGVIAIPVRRALPLWLVAVATIAVCVALERGAQAWNRRRAGRRPALAPATS